MKVFVLMDEDGITDVIGTNDTVGPRDQATIQQWLAESPEMQWMVGQVPDGEPVPQGSRWWNNLSEYMESYGIKLITEGV